MLRSNKGYGNILILVFIIFLAAELLIVSLSQNNINEEELLLIEEYDWRCLVQRQVYIFAFSIGTYTAEWPEFKDYSNGCEIKFLRINGDEVVIYGRSIDQFPNRIYYLHGMFNSQKNVYQILDYQIYDTS